MYWSGWQTLTTLIAAMLVGYALIAALLRARSTPQRPSRVARRALDRPVLLGMLVISYFGGFGPGGIIGGIGPFEHVLDHGGNNDLGLVGGLVASAAWSLIIYRLAVALRLPAEAVDRLVEREQGRARSQSPLRLPESGRCSDDPTS